MSNIDISCLKCGKKHKTITGAKYHKCKKFRSYFYEKQYSLFGLTIFANLFFFFGWYIGEFSINHIKFIIILLIIVTLGNVLNSIKWWK